MQRGFSQIFIILCVLIFIILAGGLYFLPRMGFNPFVTHSLTNPGDLPNQLVIERPGNLTDLPPIKQTITDLNKIQNLYVIATSYPPAPVVIGTFNCPNDRGLIYNLDFLKDGKTILPAVWKPDGCRYLKVGDQLVKYDSAFVEAFNQILDSIQSQPTISPTIDTSSWKTYTNTALGFTVKLPSDLVVQQSTESGVTFSRTVQNGTQTVPNALVISNYPAREYQIDKLCSLPSMKSVNVPDYPCIDEQLATQLDGKLALSMKLHNPADHDHHAIETMGELFIELNMDVSGVGLEQQFQDILSTFKFTN